MAVMMVMTLAYGIVYDMDQVNVDCSGRRQLNKLTC